MAEFFDSHCHTHTADSSRDNSTVKKWREGKENSETLLNSAADAGVTRMVCVGTDTEDSQLAVGFVQKHKNAWASVGAHPHEAKQVHSNDLRQIRKLIETDQRDSRLSGLDEVQGAGSATRKIVAVGEVGLDYYYEHSPKPAQILLLEQFLDMAVHFDLPVIFHVREAYSDFWPIYANFKSAGQRIRGVLHSFTADIATLEKALAEGLYIGLNGIITFTKDESQLEVARRVPLDNLLLETDAPYLTPVPFRGKVCKPQHAVYTAEFLAKLRGEQIEDLASQTTYNACQLFDVK